MRDGSSSVDAGSSVLPWLIAVATFLLAILVSVQLGRLDMEKRFSEARSQAIADLATIRARLEGSINTIFSATSGLNGVIAHQGEIDANLFQALARQAMEGHLQIRNIGAAPDDVITLLYPLAGNEKALGLSYRSLPEQYAVVREARRTGRPLLSGPHDLVQGGRGLIARVPVFTSRGSEGENEFRYWGIISVVTDIDTLLDHAGVFSTASLQIGLRKLDGQGRGGQLIRGNPALFAADPVSMNLDIPGGAWQIAAIRPGGWPNTAATGSPLFYVGLINSLFLAMIIWWLVRRPVHERMRNRALEQEILERKRAEEELRLSEHKYASIFNLMPDPAGITRLEDGRFLEVNEGFVRLTGWEAEELVGLGSMEVGLWTAEDRAAALEILGEKGQLENYPFTLTTKSGKRLNALMFMTSIQVRGEPCLYFIVRNITDLVEAQRRIERERFRLRNLLQTIPALVWMKDPQGVYLACNARFERLVGHSETEIIGRTDDDFFDPETAAFFRRHDRLAMEAGEARRNEEWLTYADDGHRELVETIKAPMRDADGALIGVVGVAWDITRKKEAEEALRNERSRFINLVDSVDGIVWETEAVSMTFTYVSLQAERLFGYPVEDWYRKGFWGAHIHPEDQAETLAQTAASTAAGEDHTLEYRFLANDGRVFWVQDIITVVTVDGAVRWRRGIMVDTTDKKAAEQERQNLEDQLRQAQKMEAVGRLAGGVAHDFNNKLAVILGYADLLKDTDRESDRQRYLEQIITAAAQSRDITRQLLAFSRQEKMSLRVLDLNAVVEGVRKGLGRFIREDIRFEFRTGEQLWPIMGDSTQMDQVIMNLIVNARDAMPQGGLLVVGTENVRIGAEAARAHPDLKSGEYVCLTVQDTGLGMTRETREHIFEPFYTTKETGEGTGLGLSTVYGIVIQNGGAVEVESAPGKGTTFRVYFPRCSKPQSVDAGPPEVAGSGRSATILLVEDEETVRQMAADMLEQNGYAVLTAATPARAMEICAQGRPHIDLLLTDVVMPGMNGRELAEHIRRARPDIRVLFMSGYAADVITKEEESGDDLQVIQKPFTMRSLVEAIELRLEEASS